MLQIFISITEVVIANLVVVRSKPPLIMTKTAEKEKLMARQLAGGCYRDES